jgi:hypothetical protein
LSCRIVEREAPRERASLLSYVAKDLKAGKKEQKKKKEERRKKEQGKEYRWSSQ